MLELTKILLTGFTASGKTTVGQFLQKKGAYYLETDKIVHKLLSPNTGAGKKVIDLLGEDIIATDTLDRRAIASKVFKQPNLLRNLESILHTEVLREIKAQYQRVCKERKFKFFVCEIPVLTEEVMAENWDLILKVDSKEEDGFQRFVDRTSCNQEYYHERVSRQRELMTQFLPKNHVLITNKGTTEELEEATNKVFKEKILSEIKKNY
ncbi:Dephospho-CoA kinase [Chlamydiales bacterium SCGC AB-751-O23]|jgi:dephospho-CoA kinase|nr:Dephospho-CoA kinase [Chlamydiales bacterium SCGC AB-751-O23]